MPPHAVTGRKNKLIVQEVVHGFVLLQIKQSARLLSFQEWKIDQMRGFPTNSNSFSPEAIGPLQVFYF